MENIGLLIDGFGHILSWNHILLMMIGVTLGILVGVLPGLGAPNGVSLLLPLTFSMDPISAIILLSCMYWGRSSADRPHRSCSTFPANPRRWRPRSTAIRWRKPGRRAER